MKTCSSIAVVGGMASGKSTALQVFKEEGFNILSADKILHSMYVPQHAKFLALATQIDKLLSTHFVEQKEIVRSTLRQEVGADRTKLKAMIDITKPFILNEIIYLKKYLSPVVVEFPLFFEMEAQYLFDTIICIHSSQDTQIKRIKLRHPMMKDEEIMSMLSVQKSNSYKAENSHFVIDNDSGDYKSLYNNIRNVVKMLNY